MIIVSLEVTTRLLQPVRGVIGTVLSPIQFIAESPYLLGSEIGQVVSTQDSLLERNASLQRRVLELSHVSQQFLALKTENDRLRELLGSRASLPAEVLIAELVGLVPAPNTHQILIDKGADAGVQIGQAVIDAEGLFGQVVEVSAYTSRVLLITDVIHAVPVEVNRNGVRSIATGTGRIDRLELEDLPVTADVREGDLLVSSGLGGRFPRGYPVGYVRSVLVDATRAFAQVSVEPTALLDRSRHVLIVFGNIGEVE
jgi:rod shape-determining protein MreC